LLWLSADAASSARSGTFCSPLLTKRFCLVLMRWAPAGIWQHINGEAAPREAVLLDLLEHDDPRRGT
jgi:hypothetical protein